MKKFFAISIILLLSEFGAAQSSGFSIWTSYFGNYQAKSKWLVQSDIQYRLNQFANQNSQLLLRAGLGYNLKNNNHNLLVGFAYVDSRLGQEATNTIEKRIYQQYLFRKKYKQFFTAHRVRMEERFFSSEFGLRSRYSFSFQRPLNNKQLIRQTIYAVGSNEVFIDMLNQKFDRNRLYGGIGYALTGTIRLETGFLIQTFKNTTRGQLQLTVHNNLSF
jgi:hypothetical protein